jgi:8-oxo-dGTP pyrophosphatase MutT (NUDIX family)
VGLPELGKGKAAVIEITVRSIVLSGGRILVQRDVRDPSSPYAFIGGHYELGDTLAGRLKREYEEETTARVVDCSYLFVLERQLVVDGRLTQTLDHFFEVTLDRGDVESRESHLSQHWLSVASLRDHDLRPWIVRDAIAEGRLHAVRHLVLPPGGGLEGKEVREWTIAPLENSIGRSLRLVLDAGACPSRRVSPTWSTRPKRSA